MKLHSKVLMRSGETALKIFREAQVKLHSKLPIGTRWNWGHPCWWYSKNVDDKYRMLVSREECWWHDSVFGLVGTNIVKMSGSGLTCDIVKLERPRWSPTLFLNHQHGCPRWTWTDFPRRLSETTLKNYHTKIKFWTMLHCQCSFNKSLSKSSSAV